MVNTATELRPIRHRGGGGGGGSKRFDSPRVVFVLARSRHLVLRSARGAGVHSNRLYVRAWRMDLGMWYRGLPSPCPHRRIS